MGKRGSYARRGLEPTRDRLREREQHERWTSRLVDRGIESFWAERGQRQPREDWFARARERDDDD